jgi:nucleoside-diphosphate-sugar epimerase
MKALVTGAGGAIGRRLCGRLLERGDEVRGLFMPTEDTAGLEGRSLEVARGDITDPDSISGVADGVDCVFHLAGRVLDFGGMQVFREVMTDGTANVLEQSVGKVQRFVYASSIAAFGTTRHLVGLDEDAPRMWTGIPYNDTKIECEDLVRGYTFNTGTDFTIIRPANVLGPASIWVRDTAEAFQKPTGMPLFDGGRYNACFVYVENLVDAFVLAADCESARNRVYNVRDDWEVTWKEYMEDLGALMGRKPGPSVPTRVAYQLSRLVEAVYLPFFPARPPLTRNAVAIMGHDFRMDNSRAKSELGWSTRLTYEEAMVEVSAWVKEHYPV